jgi:hypothetical protein
MCRSNGIAVIIVIMLHMVKLFRKRFSIQASVILRIIKGSQVRNACACGQQIHMEVDQNNAVFFSITNPLTFILETKGCNTDGLSSNLFGFRLSR